MGLHILCKLFKKNYSVVYYYTFLFIYSLYICKKHRKSTYPLSSAKVQRGVVNSWNCRKPWNANMTKYEEIHVLILRASTFTVLKIDLNCNFSDFIRNPVVVNLFLNCLGITFQSFDIRCLAQDLWWGFYTRIAHVAHIVNIFRL